MRPSAWALGLTFITTGALHFLRPEMYEAIMPPYLPAHRELVLISGAAEVLGGVTALSPRTHRFSRWWLIATLIAVFPANVDMAIRADEIRGLPNIPHWLLWARLPVQLLFIGWVVRATRPLD